MLKAFRKANIPMLAATGIASFALIAGVAFAASTQRATFTLTINPGVLSAAIVDNATNTEINNPNIQFADVNTSIVGAESTATLASAEAPILIQNLDSSLSGWDVTLAASNAEAKWKNASNDEFTFYNAETGLLTVSADANQTVISPAAKTVGTVSLLDSDTAFTAADDSITLASASTRSNGAWKVSGYTLTQTIPAYQPSGEYSLELTLSAVGR